MLFSVITINYNNLKGLEKTFQSVISQNNNFVEYLIIDGGSTDGSVDFIRSHKNRLAYWVSEPDKGVYHAMNKGVQKAKGDYCIFMNSGDIFYSNKILDDASKIIEREGGDFFVGNTLYVDAQGNKKMSRISPFHISATYLFRTALCHQSTFIRRELLSDNPYDETLKYVSDWKHMYHQIIFNNKTYKKLDFYVSIYDYTGMSSVNVKGVRLERENVLHEFLPKLLFEDYEYFTNPELIFLDRKKNNRLYDFMQVFLSDKKWYSVKVFLYNFLFGS